jgi:hypothetical protein
MKTSPHIDEKTYRTSRILQTGRTGGGGTLIDKIVLSMALLRVLSGSIELFAAFLMFRLNNVEKALLVNSSLALVGPLVFITITTLGLIGIADKISWSRLIWIALGLACLFFGILKK